MFIQDSNEEGEDTRMKKESPEDKEIEIRKDEEEGGRESTKEKPQMPKWLEKQLEKKAPTLMDPRARLDAILALAQINTKKEKNPKVRSKLTIDAYGSRIVQIAIVVVNEEGIGYNVSTINLGTKSREHKIDHLQVSIAMVVHLMQKDKLSKDELKAQLADLIAYIQQWSST